MTRYSPQWKENLSPMPYNTRDIEYFQGMYPQRIKELQAYVIKQCDTMDYAGSPIYDEYPDPLMLDRACTVICQSLPSNLQADATVIPSERDWLEEEQVEIYEAGSPQMKAMQWGPPPGGPPPWGPPPWGPPPGNPPFGGSLIPDIVKVLLMNELQRRRCRTGRC